MEDALDYIEKRRWGIIVTFMLHVGLLLYLQIETYDIILPQREFELISEVTEFEDYIEINPDHVITEEQFNANLNADIRNSTTDLSDKSERTSDRYSKGSVDQRVEQNARDLERQFFEEFASGRQTSSGQSNTNTNTQTSQQTQNTSQSQNTSNDSGSGGGSPDVMKKFEVAGRYPHNNDDWHIRNPGYTCGKNANGTVYVAIRVNQNGDVISARYVPENSPGANSCMIEQAERYAKMSRFNYSSSAPKTQDGFIIYTFVSRK